MIVSSESQKYSHLQELKRIKKDARLTNPPNLKFQMLIEDLLNLAQTDTNAKAIIDKYGVSRSAPANEQH
jgi:hypothetical protein